MKTTLDLPEELVREMKIRAATQGRKLREVAAEAIKRGLSARPPVGLDKSKFVKLPLIECSHPATEGEELTPERIHEVLLEQETQWHNDIAGH